MVKPYNKNNFSILKNPCSIACSYINFRDTPIYIFLFIFFLFLESISKIKKEYIVVEKKQSHLIFLSNAIFDVARYTPKHDASPLKQHFVAGGIF
jgi:hypothetical protein